MCHNSFLLRDDLILDLVVGRLRHNLLLHQVILPLVRPSLDDLGRQDKLMRLSPETSTHTIGSGSTIPERPDKSRG